MEGNTKTISIDMVLFKNKFLYWTSTYRLLDRMYFIFSLIIMRSNSNIFQRMRFDKDKINNTKTSKIFKIEINNNNENTIRVIILEL